MLDRCFVEIIHGAVSFPENFYCTGDRVTFEKTSNTSLLKSVIFGGNVYSNMNVSDRMLFDCFDSGTASAFYNFCTLCTSPNF